jgi:hypothetical protein
LFVQLRGFAQGQLGFLNSTDTISREMLMRAVRTSVSAFNDLQMSAPRHLAALDASQVPVHGIGKLDVGRLVQVLPALARRAVTHRSLGLGPAQARAIRTLRRGGHLKC